MSKLAAIKKLPAESKISLSKIFDKWGREYEFGSGDDDPAAWFTRHRGDIAADIRAGGIALFDPFLNPADIAYSYYMES